MARRRRCRHQPAPVRSPALKAVGASPQRQGQTELSSRFTDNKRLPAEHHRSSKADNIVGQELIAGLARDRIASKPLQIVVEVAEVGFQGNDLDPQGDRKSTRLNSSHYCASRMPPSAWK